MSKFEKFNSELNLEQAVAKFKDGGITWTIEMGGMGPGYEQAIQLLTWEALRRWGNKPVLDVKEFAEFFGSVAKSVSGSLGGLSGAQCGAASGLARAFLDMGYVEAMSEVDPERRIMFSKEFPHLPESA